MVASRKKQLEELKEKQGINKMDDGDNSTYLTDSEEENEKHEKNEPNEHIEPLEDVTHDKDISITIKTLMEDLQETSEENENLSSAISFLICFISGCSSSSNWCFICCSSLSSNYPFSI